MARSAVAFVVLAMTGCTDSNVASPAELRTQWKLPRALEEISGLALTADQRLLAVTDEVAIVYELDYRSGSIVRSFSVGRPALRADFEGIAVWQDRLYLISSAGVIIATSEPDPGTGNAGAFIRHETGLSEICEVEGLAEDALNKRLLIACKESYRKSDKGWLLVYAWDPQTQVLQAQPILRVRETDVATAVGKKRLNPSGIAVHPDGAIELVAARQSILTRIAKSGEVLAAQRLSGDHRQSEGLAITATGIRIIADESGGKGKARLTIYSPDHG